MKKETKQKRGVDARGMLEDCPFAWRLNAGGKVFLSYQGRQVKILSGAEAERFQKRMEAASEPMEEQLLMAKATGNFKRGNEKGR